MLSQRIVDLLPEIARLPQSDQDALAADIEADLADAKFAAKLQNGEPMPAFEALVARAKEQEARGEYIDLEEWLDEEES